MLIVTSTFIVLISLIRPARFKDHKEVHWYPWELVLELVGPNLDSYKFFERFRYKLCPPPENAGKESCARVKARALVVCVLSSNCRCKCMCMHKM